MCMGGKGSGAEEEEVGEREARELWSGDLDGGRVFGSALRGAEGPA